MAACSTTLLRRPIPGPQAGLPLPEEGALLEEMVRLVSCFTGNVTLAGEVLASYLPRRGRIKEGEAVAVYFAMNIASVFGNIRS